MSTRKSDFLVEMERLIIATDNYQKFIQAQSESKLPVLQMQPPFDENEIKKLLDRETLSNQLQYPLLISRKKFESLRDEKMRNGQEGLFLVSDSVLAVKNLEGNWIVLNRDGDEERKEAFLKLIKERATITFVGAVTFGLIFNDGPFNDQSVSVLTFCEIPLNQEILGELNLPLGIEEIERIRDPNKPIKVGYFNQEFQESNVSETNNFDNKQNNQERRARPFISGLNKDVLEIAENFANLEVNVGPVLRALISKYPFNTAIFYTLTERLTKKPDYNLIVENRDIFFEKYGGNCALFTLRLAEIIMNQYNMDTSIAIFPSKKPDKDNGHSAVLIKVNDDLSFLVDAGLSLPYLLPVSSEIPLHYLFEYGDNKKVRVSSDFTLSLHSPKGVKDFPLKNISTINEFKQILPEILSDLHEERKILKIDFHDQRGKKINSIIIDLEQKKIYYNGRNVDDISEVNWPDYPFLVDHLKKLVNQLI